MVKKGWHEDKVRYTPDGVYHGIFPRYISYYQILPLWEWVKQGFLEKLVKAKVLDALLWCLAWSDEDGGEIAWGDFLDDYLGENDPGPDSTTFYDILAWALNCKRATAASRVKKLKEMGLLVKEREGHEVWWRVNLPESLKWIKSNETSKIC